MKTLTATLLVFISLAAPALAQKRAHGSAPAASSDTITTPSGLKYIITKNGNGPMASEGQVVIAHYTGTFLDGKVFDSSREREQPFAFTLGREQVIKGWDEAFALLHVGDRATLVIPPALAYGDNEGSVIPANSTLVFDVELLELKDHAVNDELMRVLSSNGIDSAVACYQALKKNGFAGYYIDEGQLNTLGYGLLNQDKAGEAIEIFKLNAETYPESSNVYDSLAEGYMNNNNNEQAILNYKKSLELNPDNENAKEMLKRLKAIK